MLRRVLVIAGLVLAATATSVVFAGFNNNNGFGNQVGGVFVNAEGVIASVQPLDLQKLNEELAQNFNAPASALKKPVELRKVSLKAIEAELRKLGNHHVTELPDEIRYLAGIQRIQFVLLYPESNDIVIAGPGEGWKLDGKGNVIGVTTGRPVLQLEDLLVAFRTVEAARQGQLSCSIDPTPEGRQRYAELVKANKVFSPALVQQTEKALGDQKVTVSGAPDTSHFARVLVAADYKMKRIGMKLEPSPVKGVTSYIDLAPARNENMMPRWWMAANYEPLGRSEDGLAWELKGTGVKVLTEDDFVDNAAGTARGSGKASPAAQKWSEQFTAKFDELAVKEPAFGELRNVMDMSIVAALFAKENLASKAKCDLRELTAANGQARLHASVAPTKVATQCSVMKKGSSWIVTASGGVSINSWEVADKTEVVPAIGETREKAKAPASNGDGLWWN